MRGFFLFGKEPKGGSNCLAGSCIIHLQEWVQVASICGLPKGIEVVCLEISIPPSSPA